MEEDEASLQAANDCLVKNYSSNSVLLATCSFLTWRWTLFTDPIFAMDDSAIAPGIFQELWVEICIRDAARTNLRDVYIPISGCFRWYSWSLHTFWLAFAPNRRVASGNWLSWVSPCAGIKRRQVCVSTQANKLTVVVVCGCWFYTRFYNVLQYVDIVDNVCLRKGLNASSDSNDGRGLLRPFSSVFCSCWTTKRLDPVILWVLSPMKWSANLRFFVWFN